MNRKVALLEQWLRANNLNVKNEINHCQDDNKYRDIKIGLDVIISVLIGRNVTEGSKFYALENLVGTDNPTVNFIRNSSFEELYEELSKTSDEKGIKANLSMLNHSKIIDLYEDKKAKGELTTSGKDEIATEQKESRQIPNNPKNKLDSYYQPTQAKANNNYREAFESNTYKYNQNANETSRINNIQKGMTEGKDMVDICGRSLDCKIHGVRVVILPNENGSYDLRNHESYSQSMELKFNNGKDSQIVNKKTLTREEFNDFIERYRENIFQEGYSYEKTNIKENIKENINQSDTELKF